MKFSQRILLFEVYTCIFIHKGAVIVSTLMESAFNIRNMWRVFFICFSQKCGGHAVIVVVRGFANVEIVWFLVWRLILVRG